MSDDNLFAMAKRGDITKHFPFFKTAVRQVPRDCGCNRNMEQRKARKEAANTIKHAIISLSHEQKTLLKQLLHTRALTFYLNGARGVERHSI
jgi:hypothetical protein